MIKKIYHTIYTKKKAGELDMTLSDILTLVFVIFTILSYAKH